MITADFHTHTAFSDDSDATVETMTKQAILQGLKILCITDHMDYLYPAQYAPNTFVFDPDAYFAKLTKIKEDDKGQLEILIGIELGLRNEAVISDQCRTYYKRLCKQYPFDFIIGSTHILENIDPYYPEFWEDHGIKEGMRIYFESILENTKKYDMFQVYGHLDYPVRYLPKGMDKDYCFEDCRELIEEILKKLIESGRGLEVNTAGYKYGLPFAHPRPEVLALYRALGGEILTIGSDAHAPEHIAYDFAKIRELLCSLGFKYYTVYRGRKAEFLTL